MKFFCCRLARQKTEMTADTSTPPVNANATRPKVLRFACGKENKTKNSLNEIKYIIHTTQTTAKQTENRSVDQQ